MTKVALAYPLPKSDNPEDGFHDPDEVIDLPPRRARQLVRDGLARAVVEPAEDVPADVAGEPVEVLFDPSAENVDAVLAHLATADEAERTRVLDLERAGKNRQTVLAAGAATSENGASA